MKRTLLRKKAKAKTAAWWKHKLWEVFSLYIRTRDNFTCFTCGRIGTGSAIHAGHFIPASVGGLSLYFDERNVHAQCYHCNVNLGGFGARYAEVMRESYGEKIVQELWKIKNQGMVQISIPEYQEKISYYQSKLKEF